MSQQLNDTEVDEFKAILERYSIDNHKEDLIQILLSDNTDNHFPIVVDAPTLFESNIPVFDVLIHSPVQLLPLFDDALVKAQKTIHEIHPERSYMTVKEKIHVRISALPDFPELQRTSLPKNADIGNFLSVTGTVIRTTVIKMLEYEKDFICSKCKHVFQVQAAIEQYYSLSKPKKCPKQDCNSVNVLPVGEQGAIPGRCKDYQEIKIQEQVQRLSMGTIPRSMWIVVEDDLVDTCKAGDDITVCGIVMRRWRPSTPDIRCDIELFIKANHIQVTNEKKSTLLVTKEMREEFYSFWEKYKDQPLTGRNHILMSLCPQVYGLYVVKLAVILVLTGGVQRQDVTGTQVRGEIHLLLVGDPGTGKSQFLKYATKVCPRAVLTTGIGSTSAGLTVTAVRDGGEWMLEAGALVLADGGICCIDEFNSIREADKASIHEAMEQQTISVAKAGMVCKLNTRTTILAATNPKGQYDPDQSICVNVALASPLLSRFDLVMVLLDKQNEEWDKVISSYILQGKTPAGDIETSEKDLWSMDKMQIYLSMIKTINPELSEDASSVLQAYYRAQRCADTRNAARTTMRLLQSMIRLSQAHARLMLREVVTIQDAIVAITLMESTMQGAALLGGVNALHTAFPDDPEQEYKIQAEMVLKLLQLEHLLPDEMAPSQPNSQCDPGSYLSQTSSIPLVPHSPPTSNATKQKQATSLHLSADLHRDEAETSFDLFNNPLDESDDKTSEKNIFTCDMEKQSGKQISGDSKDLEMEGAQNDVSSNPPRSGLKKTIENRLNLSSSHFNPGTSSGIGGLLGSADNPNSEDVKEGLLAKLDEADTKAKLTFTTKNKGKRRKNCVSKLKGMMQQSRETTPANTTEYEKQKPKTDVVSTTEKEANRLSGKVRQLYSNYERRKNKSTEKTSRENSFDETITDQTVNSGNTDEISTTESEIFNKVQPDETKKTLVTTDERRQKSSLSCHTVSKLMKFAFDDSRTSNLSTSSSSVSKSNESLNKSDISNTAHSPAILIPNPLSSSAEPILSSTDCTIFPKSNETTNSFTTDLLSGHKWHTLPVDNSNNISQAQDGDDSAGVDSVQTTPSQTVHTAKIFTVLKHKEQNEGPSHIAQDEDLNTSPTSSNRQFNFTLPSQTGFPGSSIHVSTPIPATHKIAAAANVTKRSSSMFEIDDDDLDLDDDLDFEVGFVQSDPKRTRLK